MRFCCLILALLVYTLPVSADILIVYGDNATDVEINASKDLLNDIKRTCKEKVTLQRYDSSVTFNSFSNVILVGRLESHTKIRALDREGQLPLLEETLQPETFVLQTLEKSGSRKNTILAIVGADTRGTFYGVYEFSRQVLGVDPYEYWTGKQAPRCKNLNIPDLSYREKPPVFKLRGYFDNDNDMLANWKGDKLIVEYDIWQEMINSLARLRYNYIDIHDLLGRTEFWQWDYYTEMVEYHTDLELVDQVIDYAHSKGLLVQIPMYLGWEFHHIDLDKICLTKYYDHWMDVYEYYLTKSPIAKADMFLQRPRHPYYDTAYKCPEEKAAGIERGPLMEKMFQGLLDLINKHRPGSLLFCDLWREGREMWRDDSFQPNHDIFMLWADYGVADFREWPEDKKGYDFGIYIHAGVWLNHVMQDPYPARIKSATLEAVNRDMTKCYFVNGQDFKHFILNLEACAKCAWDPYSFDPEIFYTDWTSRYFAAKSSQNVVKSLKLLHAAHQPVGGFRQIMAKSVDLLKALKDEEIVNVPMDSVAKALELAAQSLLLAEETEKLVPDGSKNVYDDQIVFPARIYYENLKLLESVTEFNNAAYLKRITGESDSKTLLKQKGQSVYDQLVTLRDTLAKGSIWQKWEGWTHPDHFRVYTPPPAVEETRSVLKQYGVVVNGQ